MLRFWPTKLWVFSDMLWLLSGTKIKWHTVDQVYKHCMEFHLLQSEKGVSAYCSNSLYSVDYNTVHTMLSSDLIQLASIHCPFHLSSHKERQTTLAHCDAVLFVVRISDSALSVFLVATIPNKRALIYENKRRWPYRTPTPTVTKSESSPPPQPAGQTNTPRRPPSCFCCYSYSFVLERQKGKWCVMNVQDGVVR